MALNSIRETIQKNPLVGYGAAAACLALAIAYAFMGGDTEELTEYDWWYDLDSKSFFKGPVGDLPPIASKSGPDKGLKAYLYSCSSCDDKASRFVGYLEMYTPQAKEARSDRAREQVFMAGHMIRRPDDAQWVPFRSGEGKALMSELMSKKCQGKPPTSCIPE
jgi:hypothetical protein